MELECYPTTERPPEIVPGRTERDWMDAFAPPRLPLPAAEHGQHSGWEILCPVAFTAEWNGGIRQRISS
jgi:hypothetical protein